MNSRQDFLQTLPRELGRFSNLTGHEGLKDMLVFDAIYESLRKNGSKVFIKN